ncbi:hypothetical protein PT276_01370 [Orbaceae bacterium ESL0721]|nr:hypothetical protein [Orbaceae bacterium ESL0721]
MEQHICGDNLGNVVNAKIVNIHHSNHDKRLLVPAQRHTLHNLISDIENYGELTDWQVWLKLHATLGVSSINEITISQFEKAYNFLIDELNASKERRACNVLIHMLLVEINKNSNLKDCMNCYCKKQFGTANLKQLTKIQLQAVLSYVEEQATMQQTQSINMINQLSNLIKYNKQPVAIIAIVSFALGAIIF